MSDIEQDKQLSYAEKIAKLLNKAENTDSQDEADALNARAQALMIKYAISERLLAQAQGRQLQDKVIEETLVYKGIFHMALMRIGHNIAIVNNCKTVMYQFSGQTRTDLHVIGFESDVSNVKLLDASLQIQASTEMQKWYRTQNTSHYTAMQKSKMRRTFLMGFASGLHDKLQRANREGIQQAVADETTRTGDAVAARMSTDLVLKSKAEQVDDWVDNKYGNSLRSARSRYTQTSYSDRAAGHAAGMRASINQTGIGGTHRELGS